MNSGLKKKQEITLHLTLKKLRKTCKISQEKLSEILGLDQASISRMESGNQMISAEHLIQISRFFNIPLDSIVMDNINYWALAKKFGQKPALKRRYKDQSGGVVREFLPLIIFLNKKHGSAWTKEALKVFELESIPFIDPNEEISKNCYLDFLVHCISNEKIKKSDISDLAKEYASPEIYGEFSRLLFSSKDPLSMALTYSNASNLHDSLIEASVLEMGRNQVVLGLEKKDHIGGKKFLTESGLDSFLSEFELKKYDNLLKHSFQSQYSIQYLKEFGPGLKGQAELIVSAS